MIFCLSYISKKPLLKILEQKEASQNLCIQSVLSNNSIKTNLSAMTLNFTSTFYPLSFSLFRALALVLPGARWMGEALESDLSKAFGFFECMLKNKYLQKECLLQNFCRSIQYLPDMIRINAAGIFQVPDLSSDEREEQIALMSAVPKLKQRIGGKSIPSEKFAVKKADKFNSQVPFFLKSTINFLAYGFIFYVNVISLEPN